MTQQLTAQSVLQAKAMLSAASAVPQLEQADKLLTRLPEAKWAADMHTLSSKALRHHAPQRCACPPACVSCAGSADYPQSC